ncbi:MAG: phosphatase PAP2 family protein [Mucilaginibacter polytrichastri]|nr:phosphatase PAP2 family protein [Mucilaginibacter polytrichastri]
MQMLTISHIRRQPLYFSSIILLFAGGLCLALLFDKREIFIRLNAFHCPATDTFFSAYIETGNGCFLLLLVLIFIIRKRWLLSLHCVSAFLLSGLLVQIVKRIFVMPRPGAVFSQASDLFISGYHIHQGHNSFPSGHTATAFALVTVCTLYLSCRWRGLILFILATLTGFSRVYLGQHFFGDVLAGATIGVGCAFLVCYAIRADGLQKLKKQKSENQADRLQSA